MDLVSCNINYPHKNDLGVFIFKWNDLHISNGYDLFLNMNVLCVMNGDKIVDSYTIPSHLLEEFEKIYSGVCRREALIRRARSIEMNIQKIFDITFIPVYILLEIMVMLKMGDTDDVIISYITNKIVKESCERPIYFYQEMSKTIADRYIKCFPENIPSPLIDYYREILSNEVNSYIHLNSEKVGISEAHNEILKIMIEKKYSIINSM